MRKNEYSLASNSPLYYLNLFDAANFKITKNLECNSNSQWVWNGEFEAVMGIGCQDDYTHFEMYLKIESEVIPAELKTLARTIVSNVVKMDNEARSIPSDFEHNEQLAYITLDQKRICFRYYANDVNTEWDVVFQFVAQNDWICLGIPNYNTPGEYITK